MVLALASAGYGANPVRPTTVIEVTGPPTAQVTVPIAPPANAATLWLKTENLVDSNQASLIIDRGVPIPLNNTNCQPEGLAAQLNGIGGPLTVVTFTTPAAAIFPGGSNSLTFVINSTPQNTVSAFRVLEVNFLDSNGNLILPPQAPVAASGAGDNYPPAAVSAGSNLWFSAPLVNVWGGTNISAHCGDCHSIDGSDIAYFGFSDLSIQTRSAMHGLSTNQAWQVLAYLRSLPTTAYGSPWNPPFQPGTNIDNVAPNQWAAGAGINAVATNDALIFTYLFGTNQPTFNFTNTINIRTLPIAMPLPTWNDWLPAIFPLDYYGNDFTNIYYYYKVLSQSVSPTDFRNRLGDFSSQWANFENNLLNNHYNSTNQMDQLAWYSACRWRNVKIWEILHSNGWEGQGQLFDPWSQTVSRVWPDNGVFHTAPHFSIRSETDHALRDGSPLTWNYLSAQWYWVQLALNDSQHHRGGASPIDWSYLLLFAEGPMAYNVPTAAQTLVALTKAAESGTGDPYSIYGDDSFLPWRVARTEFLMDRQFPEAWQSYDLNSRNSIFNAWLGQWSTWIYALGRNYFITNSFTLEAIEGDTNNAPAAPQGGSWIGEHAALLQWLEANQADISTVKMMVDLATYMWPAADWSAYASYTNISAATLGTNSLTDQLSLALLSASISNNAVMMETIYTALMNTIMTNATIDRQNLESVSNLLFQTVFGSSTNLFSVSTLNEGGLYAILTNYLAMTSNGVITSVAETYETSSNAAMIAAGLTNLAASDAANLFSISNLFVQAGFGGSTNFAVALTNGLGLYGMLTNSVAITSNSILASVAGANQATTSVAANLNAVSNLLAQAGFGNGVNIFNLASTNGIGLYGLIINYLTAMSNSIVASVASAYETVNQAAAISNTIAANAALEFSTYSYISTNRLADNGQTLSPCANGVATYSTQFGNYSSFLSFTSQSWHTNFQNADGIRLVYSSSAVGWPSGESYVVGAGPFDLVAAVGYVQNGVTNWVVARWNGSEIVLVNPNSKIISDDIGISIPYGGTFLVRTWCNRDVDNTFSMPDGTRGLLSVQSPAFPVSVPYFRGGAGNLNNGNGTVFVNSSVAGSNPFTNTPFTLLTSGVSIAGGANQAFYPCAILGHSRINEQTNVILIGDSVANGTSDEYNIRMDGGVGYLRGAVFGSFGFVQLTAGGEKLSHWLNDLGAPARGSFILGATRIICELGSNDAASGTNLVALQSEAVAVWTRLAKAGGGRVWATTLAPRSTSSDFFATTNNQVAVTNNSFTSIRNSYNDWLRVGAPIANGAATTNGARNAVYAGQIGHPLAGVFDTALACEPYVDAGIWTAPATNVYGGVATAATPTTYTDSTANWSTTANYGLGQMAGLVLIDLTHKGAATILSNTTNTVTFASGQTIPGLSAGDTVKIIAASTFDGVHPLPQQNVLMAGAIPASSLR